MSNLVSLPKVGVTTHRERNRSTFGRSFMSDIVVGSVSETESLNLY